MDERDDINKYREKEKQRKTMTRLIVTVIAAAVVVIAAINWKSIIAPFKDIGNKAGEGGFPINLTGSANYVMGEMGENFFLLTDTYLHTYNENGAELMNKQHGLQKPICSSNSKRALVYDKNGKDIKVFSKNSESFTKTFEDSIVFAKMGTDERCAVVTTSSRYSNFLYVLNSEGKQIFCWASPDEMIMQVCFEDGDKGIYVSVVGEKDGSLNSSVLRFELREETKSETWRAAIGGSVSYSLEECAGGVYAVTPNGAFLIDAVTGAVKASNAYTREIFGIAPPDGVFVTIFRDSLSNGAVANAYNDKLEATAAVTLENLSAFAVDGGRLYILSGSKLTVYDEGLKPIDEKALDDEYSDLIVMGKHAYLLGYNKVQRQDL